MATKKDRFSNMLGQLPTKQETVSKSTATLHSIVEGAKPEYRYIRLDNIRFNPENDYAAADTGEEIQELASDIRRNGLLHNVIVSQQAEGGYLLLSGERRLRAYLLLREQHPGEEKWQEIYSLVRKELTPVEEVLILDAANLQVRGSGAGGEARYRRAMARFVENLRKHDNISEAEAVALTKKWADVSDSTITRNLSIEKKLIPGLKKLLDEGVIKKLVANSYAALSEEEQRHVLESYEQLLQTAGQAGADDYSQQVAEAMRAHKPVKSVRPKPAKKAGTAMERQREGFEKNCDRMEKMIDGMQQKAALIKRVDEDMPAAAQERALRARVEALYKKLGALRDALQ